MKNHCDIYKVTLISRYSETETGGLHEQESDKGVFQSDISAVSGGFKRNKADHFKRILLQRKFTLKNLMNPYIPGS
jgi:hypothetical protein